jgi:hypothetical protein
VLVQNQKGGDMQNKNSTSNWLDRACASVGLTFAEARTLWIAVRRGDDAAKLALNRLLRDNPAMASVFEHLSVETQRIRADRGLKNPRTFGKPERKPQGAYAKVQSKRVKGVSGVVQGGLPSLGKRN